MNTIIAINYRDNKSTLDLIKSFDNKLSKQNFELIIIDNSPIDNFLENEIKRYSFNMVSYHKNNLNLGYFPAALNYIKEKKLYLERDSISICNVDILFNEVINFENMIKNYLNTNIGIVGPKIINSNDKRNQNPFLIRRTKKVKFKIWNLFYQSYLSAYILNVLLRFKNKFKNHEIILKNQEVYAVHGAFIIMTRNFLKNRKLFDFELPLLFAEEYFIAELCLQMRLKLIINDNVSVIHNEHQSTGINFSRFKYKCQCEAQEFIVKNFFK